MANFAAATIPLNSIRKVGVVVTDCKRTLAQVKSDTGADYLLNGTLYNLTTGAVNCHLRVDGKVLAKPNYTVRGYAWESGEDFSMTVLPCNKPNYIACTPLIINGEKQKLIYSPGQGGVRGRTAIGVKGDRLALYCTKDGTGSARSPEQLRDDLYFAGWESAVMLDGGTSSQCNLNGQIVQSLDNQGNARNVQHWICVWLNHPEPDNDLKRRKVLETAAGEIGTKESPEGTNLNKYGAWYGLNGYAWCMMFVQWVFAQAGLSLPIKTASCTELANWARNHKQWITKDFEPGDILFMHWGKNQTATEHVGVVEKVCGTYVVTVEGNTSLTSQDNGGAVMRRNRAYANITGAYRPWYNK